MEKAFREKKCISSKFELARFHQGTDDLVSQRHAMSKLRILKSMVATPGGIFALIHLFQWWLLETFGKKISVDL